jgi:hypothetical protein
MIVVVRIERQNVWEFLFNKVASWLVGPTLVLSIKAELPLQITN